MYNQLTKCGHFYCSSTFAGTIPSGQSSNLLLIRSITLNSHHWIDDDDFFKSRDQLAAPIITICNCKRLMGY